MSIIKNILGNFFGSKSDRDLKVLKPVIEKVEKVSPAIELLSDDELRGKTSEFQNKIKEAVSKENSDIDKIQTTLDNDEIEITHKEASYKKIDELKKQVYNRSEEVLADILPEAFAVVKETARRLAQNKQLKVTARGFDKDLASEFNFVTIDGDDAIWSNKWLAFGAEQIWNMVHYDVQKD